MLSSSIRDILTQGDRQDLATDLEAYAMRLTRRVQNIASFPERKMLRTFGDVLGSLGGTNGDERMNVRSEVEAFIALQAVGEAVEIIRESSSLKVLVNDKMDQLIAWVHYFYSLRIQKLADRTDSNKDEEQRTVKNLSATLFAIFFPLESKFLKRQIKSSYEVISGLWLAEEAKHPTGIYPYASKILSELFHQTPKDAALIEALLQSAKGDADKVAQAAILKLRKAMTESPDERGPITMHFIIVTSLASGRKHAVSIQLYNHEIFTTISKCIRLLSALPDTAGTLERQAFENAFGLYVSVITDMVTFDAENGTRALKQCIRYGALDGIVQLLVLHSDDTVDEPLASNIKHLISFLISYIDIRAVCIETINVFKNLSLLEVSVETLNSPLQKMWKRFVDTVVIQSVFVKLADIEIGFERSPQEICFHCKQEFAKSILRKCGKCKNVKYCSKECQAQDWKIQHWYKCSSFAEAKKYKTFPRYGEDKYEDNAFVMRLARFDIRRHRTHLQQLATKKYPNVHPDLVGFVVNYCEDPPTINALLVENLKIDGRHPPIITKLIGRANSGLFDTSHPIAIKIIYTAQIGHHLLTDLCIETYEEGDEVECPRPRPGIEHYTEKRTSCRFTDRRRMISLEASYDEVDEIVRRMTVYTTKHPEMLRDLTHLVDQVLEDLKEDCPFEQLKYLLEVPTI